MLRTPVVAGQFYPATALGLKKQLSGLCPACGKKEDARGLIMPHAGYVYSGKVAGAVISRINLKNILIIIGPNHTGMGEIFSLDRDELWQTPLGKIKINSGLSDEIIKNSKYIKKDSAAHRAEHSIEVELPFAQYVSHDPDNISIVPIVIGGGNLEIYKNIGVEIAAAVKKLNLAREAQIIASSDMTHYEESETARIKDKKVLDAVLKLDPDLVYNTVKREDVSMCGYAPCVIMLEAMRRLGASKAKLVKYENSGDTTGDYSSVVGYAGVLIN
ncbi:MAG: AmmeMemoRadiSam system protein B [Candidatus Omnitrophica bacterium CG11_big_fil_rev_8_21_14_0_20_42_13]|uniref:MEMO1 family protein COV72_00550 n=1 Tax=Candidatus Ghiorseimicrobium undicola TaxID=1974746 RepID=A0A2H0LZU5_9BACT|nr:MAG: AmmeMemoRadiSam system protein B [Candidatus Omnitrophica bacterium CG11_big_fil_rev_8_21_14_0_20_42_13]